MPFVQMYRNSEACPAVNLGLGTIVKFDYKDSFPI